MFSFNAEARASTQASAVGRATFVPGPRGRQLLATLHEVRRDRINFVTQAAKEYGDFVGFRMGHKRLYLLSHPEHARHILYDNPSNYRKGIGQVEARPLLGEGLLTSEGDLWTRQRQLLQAAFHGEQLTRFGAEMTGATHSMLEGWTQHADTGRELDVSEEMVRLTLKILGATLFRFDFSSITDALSTDLNVLTNWAMARLTNPLSIPFSFPTPRNLQARRALNRLDRIVRLMIETRRRQGVNGGSDLLSLLLGQTGQQELDEKQVRDEVMTFLLAGHETTAATLAWTIYLLAQHPAAAERLHDEVEHVLAGRAPTQSDLPQLAYTRMVIEESLRLYPPIWLIPRRAIERDRIGEYEIPANSDILFCVYSLHRHAAFWPDPDKFEPERFAAEKSSARVACSYLPFGAGPRSCLGGRFGMMEATFVLAMVAQRYRLSLGANHRVKPEASLSLHPRDPLMMKIHSR